MTTSFWRRIGWSRTSRFRPVLPPKGQAVGQGSCAIIPSMRLRDIGEFELIERMAPIFGNAGAVVGSTTAAFSRLALGIGDDAAVWEEAAGVFSIATTDALVEGVHFTHETTSWYDLGWTAMASNVSDIAGMGASPRFALVVLGAVSYTHLRAHETRHDLVCR